MNRNLIFCLIILIFSSCKEKNKNDVNFENEPKVKTEKKKNITTEISTDINQLEKLINLSEFRPEKVKFKYTFIDNSGGRVPGPSDSFLEALLYFDDKTMEKIRETDQNASLPVSNYQKHHFTFSWLDKETLSELEQSDSLKSIHPDLIFGTNNGGCLYLKNKILLIKEVN
ncbi:hypothetical protein [Chryseobacterium shigense]|uniref:Lipoprotein n=1 Tax=Chryseobacterium shigense TaxID=297244 RepID=A0A841N5V4_9FLAO|nr:hypothetical protein [Chryseobacterium shigense]MBB6372476.1 hypothetical protein [Chryseobacterium shigense]